MQLCLSSAVLSLSGSSEKVSDYMKGIKLGILCPTKTPKKEPMMVLRTVFNFFIKSHSFKNP